MKSFLRLNVLTPVQRQPVYQLPENRTVGIYSVDRLRIIKYACTGIILYIPEGWDGIVRPYKM